MGPGNPPEIRFLAGISVRFGSTPGQKPDLHCLAGFVTRTTHIPMGFRPGWTQTAVPFYGLYNFGSTLALIKYLSSDRIVT
jgi:hypothetical protein